MASKQRDRVKERFWRGALKRHGRSGLSVAEFCRREGLRQPSFYTWRRTIVARDGQFATPSSGPPRAIGFLPVRVTGPAPLPSAARSAPRGATIDSITIELGEGLVLRLPELTSMDRIAELVKSLRETRR